MLKCHKFESSRTFVNFAALTEVSQNGSRSFSLCRPHGSHASFQSLLEFLCNFYHLKEHSKTDFEMKVFSKKLVTC